MIYIFVGMPGSGKGTRAKVLSEKLNIPTISPGVILRDCFNELPLRLKEMMRHGDILPAKEVNKIIFNRLKKEDCKNGYILDGFPRSLEQAEDLEEHLKSRRQKILKVFVLEADEHVIIDRIKNRLECPKCKATYNEKGMEPKKEGICDVCGHRLNKRIEDGSEEVIKNRIEIYYQTTLPIINYYKNKGLVEKIDANKEPEEILKHI